YLDILTVRIINARKRIVIFTSLIKDCEETTYLFELLKSVNTSVHVVVFADKKRNKWLSNNDYSFLKLIDCGFFSVFHQKGILIDGKWLYSGVNFTSAYLRKPIKRYDFLIEGDTVNLKYYSSSNVNSKIYDIAKSSNKKLYIFTPYLNFDESLYQIIQEKIELGVDVKVLTTELPFGSSPRVAEKIITKYYFWNINNFSLHFKDHILLWKSTEQSTHLNIICNENETLWTSSNLNQRSLYFDKQNGVLTKTSDKYISLLMQGYHPIKKERLTFGRIKRMKFL
ncbi:phospholipase D-like domain-containing protein, partial [Photobacterium makurazakiensis]|uniref:phospholipase D-like domain-containing protein n=1 Tax=Photobacterium makurazakiensis TaxID=2910234 RepID=UPI003D0F8EB9